MATNHEVVGSNPTGQDQSEAKASVKSPSLTGRLFIWQFSHPSITIIEISNLPIWILSFEFGKLLQQFLIAPLR